MAAGAICEINRETGRRGGAVNPRLCVFTSIGGLLGAGGNFHVGMSRVLVRTCQRGRASFVLLDHAFRSRDKFG